MGAAAIEKGMGSSFLQTTDAEVLRKVVNAHENMIESQRQKVLAFLSGQQGDEYAPVSGEIVDILEQMYDTLKADVDDMVAKEIAADDALDDLQASIEAAEATLTQQAASVEAGTGRITLLKLDLKSHENDKRAAKDARAEATAIRKKEKAVFDKDLADITANLAAIFKATGAIQKGMGSSFLQSTDAEVLRKVVNAHENMIESQRQEVLAFLSGQIYASPGGEIVDILKQMSDTMSAHEKDLVAREVTALKDNDKKVSSLTKSIEVKTARIVELGVEITMMAQT